MPNRAMSESMQRPVSRPPRAERTTTSCGECRRRKQKCNQGQPCSNCARRFPQPVCEYKLGSRRPSAVPVAQRPAFTISLSPPAPARNEGFDAETLGQRVLPHRLPLATPWNQHQSSTDVGGLLPDSNWSAYGALDPFSTAESPVGQYAWSTDQHSLSVNVIACEEGCTAHSNEVHDAIRTLHAHRSTQGHWAGGGGWAAPGYSAWTLVPTLPSNASAGGLSWPLADPAQQFSQAPVVQPMQDAELLSIYVKFLSQFTASVDGKPDASNPYIKYYVPYCVNSQLLVRVAIYSAACFLTDTGHVERTTAMAHKGRVIALLNEHIQSQASPSDEVIAGVVQLIGDEWLWGNADDLRKHLSGLREMIRYRGGFRTLGLHGLISKLAITCDVAIALSFETSPFLRGGSEFEFGDNSQIPLRLSLNTPFISTLVAFASCAEALHIHPATASILDDMRFLLAAVLALPDTPSAKELQKVHTTSAWLHERISSLPEDSPTARRRPPPAGSPGVESRDDQQQSGGRGGRSSAPRQHRTGQTLDPNIPPTHTQRHSHPHPHPYPSMTPSPPPPPSHHQQPPPPGPLPTSAPPQPSSPTPNPDVEPDPIYQTTRLAALLYARAIYQRLPFSAIVSSPTEFLRLWTTAWRVPLSTWRGLLGVLAWVLLPLLPGGKPAQPHDRFVKGLANICLFQVGVENWEVGRGVMEAGVRLQRWLAGGNKQGEDGEVGEGGRGGGVGGGGGGGGSGSGSGSGSKAGVRRKGGREGSGESEGDEEGDGESGGGGKRMLSRNSSEEERQDRGNGKGPYTQASLWC